MRHPGPFAAEIGQHPGQGFDPLAREDAGELALDAGRIGQGAQQIENGAGAQLDARRTDMAHGAVVAGRHHEADPRFPDGFLDQGHVGVDVDSQGQEHIRGPGFGRQGPVAVLGDGDAGGGDHQGGAGGDVVSAGTVTAGADNVDGAGRRLDRQGLGAHDAKRAGDLLDGFAAHPERHQKSTDLGGGGLPRHDDLEGGLGLVFGQRRAGRHLADQLLHGGGGFVHAAAFPLLRSRKFLSR